VLNLDPPLALLLGVTGGVLQYAIRQFDHLPEWVYHLAAVGLCFVLYVLVTPAWNQGEWRGVVINAVTWLAERVPTVWGGTFLVSNAAKAVAGRNGGAAGNMMVPVTNSK
jgi:hypothetical protein